MGHRRCPALLGLRCCTLFSQRDQRRLGASLLQFDQRRLRLWRTRQEFCRPGKRRLCVGETLATQGFVARCHGRGELRPGEGRL